MLHLQAVAKRSTVWTQLLSYEEVAWGSKIAHTTTYALKAVTYNCPSHLAAVLPSLAKLTEGPATNIVPCLWMADSLDEDDITAAKTAATDSELAFTLTGITQAAKAGGVARECLNGFTMPVWRGVACSMPALFRWRESWMMPCARPGPLTTPPALSLLSCCSGHLPWRGLPGCALCCLLLHGR